MSRLLFCRLIPRPLAAGSFHFFVAGGIQVGVDVKRVAVCLSLRRPALLCPTYTQPAHCAALPGHSYTRRTGSRSGSGSFHCGLALG